MAILKVIFWVLVLLALYPYFGYPVLLALLDRMRRKRIIEGDRLPSVTMVIPAYNEEAVIGQKLRNSLATDYPVQRLEIIVVSDASDDRTDEIVRRFAPKGVRLLVNPERKGKTHGLNRACSMATGDIFVFTDANSMFQTDTLRHMVRKFADPEVGLVTGSTRYTAVDAGGGVVAVMGAYGRLENWIKERESRIASCIGADGAIFAMRRELYRVLDEKDINDFVIPLNVVRQRKRVVLDSRAYCLEEHDTDEAGEYSRQIRITNRTIRAMLVHRDLLNPARYGLTAWMLWSHKMLRFLLPWFALLLLMVDGLLLLLTGSVLYQVVAILFAAVLLVSVIGSKGKSRVLALLRSFIRMNLACFIAWLKVFRGQTIVVWDKSQNG